LLKAQDQEQDQDSILILLASEEHLMMDRETV
jgi:hypothetical protein